MSKSNFASAILQNEPVKHYAPGSEEVKILIFTKKYAEELEIPMVIGGKNVTTKFFNHPSATK